VDASPLVAQMWLTNGVTEGSGSGDFGDVFPVTPGLPIVLKGLTFLRMAYIKWTL